MAVAALQYLSPDEYLSIERAAETKSEYYAGKMYAMAGASREHIIITGSAAAELRQQLRQKPCEVYSTDMRLKVGRNGLYTYPDVIVVCGTPEFTDSKVDTLTNPTVIIEVLSPSTADYDHRAKFEFYRDLDSLQEYIMIWQDRPHVEQYSRQPSGKWVFSEANGIESMVVLESIGCKLTLSELYHRIEFVDPAAPPIRPAQRTSGRSRKR